MSFPQKIEEMNTLIDTNRIIIDSETIDKLRELYKHYRKHEFDLLGSGYVCISYGMKPRGAYGYRYHSNADVLIGNFAKNKVRNICKKDYNPINWFIDYKSGYLFDPIRYNSKKKCEQAIGKYQGVDIKCPWELGRLYHVVRLAVLALFDEDLRDEIAVEYKNCIEDFICMNPVGKTVQWSAPMDVSIRMVNLAISYDLIRSVDNKMFDERFEKKIEEHLRKSLRYVIDNLEYVGKYSSNHYLSNIVGIIFGAAYLSSDRWTDSCLVFGTQELINQTLRQFHREGSHFEGSTSYHRLSAEFVVYCTALIYGILNSPRKKVFDKYDHKIIDRLRPRNRQRYGGDAFFPREYIDRLFRMGLFTESITKQNNEIVQIGDNDSGRLMKITPLGKIQRENEIDHRGLLAALAGLFPYNIFEKYCHECQLERSLISALSKGKEIDGITSNLFEDKRDSNDINLSFESYPYSEQNILYADKSARLLDDETRVKYFAEFGLVIIKSKRVFLSMVIDTSKNTQLIGHTHNDKLSIELMVDGKYITRDPGSYVYTAAPTIRNVFRSTASHNTIYVNGIEQNIFNGTFDIKKTSNATILSYDNNRIVAKAVYRGVEHVREVLIDGKSIIVNDYANKPFEVNFDVGFYSYGYGKKKGRIKNDC